MSVDIAQRYSFSYTTDDGKIIETSIQTPGFTWMDCLNDYIRFLEQIYQYPIMGKIRIEKPAYRKAILEAYEDYADPWTGEYFTREKDENPSNS